MKKTYFFIYTILFFFAFFFLTYIGIYDANNNTRQYVSSSDVILWDDYQIRPHGDVVTLEGDISSIPNINNILAFYSIHQDVTIYCDNLLIYEYPVKNNNPIAVTSGYTWNFVTLPKANCHLIINFTSPYDGYAEKIPKFYSGSIPAIVSQIINENIISFLLCFIIFCIGICMVIYWLYMRFHLPIKLNLLQLGVFAILLSVWSANESSFSVLLMKNNIISSYIAFISLMLLPLPFALFVKSHYEDNSKMWDIYCIADVIQIALCLILQMFKLVDLHNTLWSTHAMIIILLVLVLYCSFKLLKERHNNTNVKIHLLCICICAITSALDLFAFYLGFRDCNTFGRVGFLLYVIILGFTSVKDSASLMKLGRKANTYQRLAFTDQMTKMSNRTAFHRDFEILSSSPDDIAIINLDLNNLKQINDTLGHNIGDEYIINSAKIISNTFAHVGKCYRVGGDEFVVIIEKASHFDFRYYFNLMEWSIDSFNARQKDIHMQIAYGYAVYDSDTDKKLDDTQSRADKCMYINKKEKKKIRS